MTDIKKGRYWDFGWQLIDGCTPCSPGCDHCWSAAMTQHYRNFVDTDGNPFIVEDGRFTGEIRTYPERLNKPLKRKKPTVYAIWNDLFHDGVLNDSIEQVFGMVLSCPQHKFLILTKRAKGMLKFFKTRPYIPQNTYLGLTVCNQQEANEKIPVFLQVPGKKFLSIEPMLGPIKMQGEWIAGQCMDHCETLMGMSCDYEAMGKNCKTRDKGIGAVILGGETGPGARLMEPGWARSVVQQCRDSNIPVFVKQIHISGKVNKNMNEWPEELRVRDLPWLKP